MQNLNQPKSNVKIECKKETEADVDADEDADEIEQVEEKEQVYPKIKSKVEILDVIFHPTECNLITLGLINGKLKMLKKNFIFIFISILFLLFI